MKFYSCIVVYIIYHSFNVTKTKGNKINWSFWITHQIPLGNNRCFLMNYQFSLCHTPNKNSRWSYLGSALSWQRCMTIICSCSWYGALMSPRCLCSKWPWRYLETCIVFICRREGKIVFQQLFISGVFCCSNSTKLHKLVILLIWKKLLYFSVFYEKRLKRRILCLLWYNSILRGIYYLYYLN